jgi:hypothetical protein
MPLFYITTFVCNVNIARSSNLRSYHHPRDQCRALAQKGFVIPSPLPLGKSPVGSLATSTPEFASHDLILFTRHFRIFLLWFFATFLLYGSGPKSTLIPHRSFDRYPDHRPKTGTLRPGILLRHTATRSRNSARAARRLRIVVCDMDNQGISVEGM